MDINIGNEFVNSLTPVTEIAVMGNIKGKLSYQDAQKYLESRGKNIDNFYFTRDNYQACFCYYKDFVLLDIPVLSKKALQTFATAELIDFEEARLNNCIKKKNFISFFYMVNKKIALKSYNQLFNLIPDKDKYSLFWFIYSQCDYRLDYFPRDYIMHITKFGPETLPIDQVNGSGEIRIYRGQTLGSTPVNKAFSWTLDINTAIYFATRHGYKGSIYQCMIPKDKVVAFIKRKNEKEILVFPGDAQQIEEINLISFKTLIPELKSNGIFDIYNKFAGRLKEDYFCRPFGIHGLSHTRRVLMLTLILANKLGLDTRQTSLLCTCALYHDIGRTNDNFDPRHGYESWKKLQAKGLINFDTEDDIQLIKFIIENHCIDDKTALNNLNQYKISDKNEAELLFNIFKDADGLDRIRINDLDINRLRTSFAKKLPLVARELLQEIN